MKLVARFAVPVIAIAAAAVLAGCGGETVREVPVEVPVTREVERVVVETVTVEVPVEVEKVVTVEVPKEPSGDIPFAAAWVSSGHADTEAEAFVHWDEEDPALVPTSCAKCHSAYGHQDFLGVDGTAVGVVDNAAAPSVLTCVTCHNEATRGVQTVVFPSGVEVSDLGESARCAQCHQGRASTVQVDASIERAGAGDPDVVNPELGFTNVHYMAAAATQNGGVTLGGYQYEGKTYDVRFAHVENLDSCADCHDPHSLEVQLETCSGCHANVMAVEDVRDIRMAGSLADFDGDGDIEEGIYYELVDMQAALYEAIRAYATAVSATPIVYEPHTHPYFFIDTNGNGQPEADEAAGGNRYNAWTPRLAKAAYNYQFSLKDPGAYAHGGKYVIELLYDSIDDLNQALDEPIDQSAMHRTDPGHFAGSDEVFRHWDAEGEVPGSCSRCHSADGLPLFVTQQVAIAQEPSNGLQCSTCHDSLDTYTRFAVTEVTFPSGATLASDEPDANLCMTCHQGRQSTVSVDRHIGDVEDDVVSENLRFQNVHYFAAGATLFGGEALGAYQYADQTYAGRNTHVETFDTCTECHSAHALEVRTESCATCHDGADDVEALRTIRMGNTDHDGDGDRTDGAGEEVSTLHEMLYTAIQAYARDVAERPIVYESHQHPYFFIDTNGNGEADPDEVSGGNAYNAWTPRLLRAAYNYQYVAKDPGAFAHNGTYIMQILYDSITDLDGDTVEGAEDLQRAR